METSNNEFYHFGILPQKCIHTPIPDQYSKMYIPQESCECGCKDWVDSTMELFKMMPVKHVHRCAACNEVRIANHLGSRDV